MFDCRNDESLMSAIADIVIEDLHIQGIKRQDDRARVGRRKRAAAPAMEADMLEAIVDDVLEQLVAETAPDIARKDRRAQDGELRQEQQMRQASRHCECCVLEPMQCPMRANAQACNEPARDDLAVIRFKRLTERREHASFAAGTKACVEADAPLFALSDEQAEILFLRTELARSQLELKRMKSRLRANGANCATAESIFTLPHADSMTEWLPIERQLAQRRFAC
jgi:hypothetical protein